MVILSVVGTKGGIGKTPAVQKTIATMVSAAYLWWPGDVDPLLILVPTILACAALGRFQAKYYKKYV